MSELTQLIKELGGAFEEFKTRSDARFDELEKRMNRPIFGGGGGDTTIAGILRGDAKTAFNNFFRKGDDTLLASGKIETKAGSVAVGSDGGYAVPSQIDAMIEKLERNASPIRQIAAVRSATTSDYKVLINRGGTESGWVGEQGARSDTDHPQLGEFAPPMGEIYAQPTATQKLLDDAAFDVEAWYAEEVAEVFAEQEDIAFVSGNGVNKPRGFLTYDLSTDADATRSLGQIQYVTTGVSGAFPTTNPADKLIQLLHTLRPVYRPGAVWVMNSNTVELVRKFKDDNKQYLWQPSTQAGQPPTLLGYEVIEDENMPDPAANSLSVAFGNFARGYLIVDRMGVRVLRDPYTNKPYVRFYTTKRVGGGVKNSEAIKLLKFSA